MDKKLRKIDFKKELKQLYSGKPGVQSVVEVPAMNFLMIDGEGSPAGEEYMNAVQALYPVAYALKFMCKKELEQDYVVPPLESLWWMEDMTKFSADKKDEWLWRAMIMQPGFVTEEMFKRAVEQVRKKKNPKSLERLRFEGYAEGRAAQVMYIGPYAEEEPTIKKLHSFIRENGGELKADTKHHHEIYISDPRRVEPSKLKTIIRQPF